MALGLLLALAVTATPARPSFTALPTRHSHKRRAHAMTKFAIQELTLVDEDGQPKMRLFIRSGSPILQMMRPNGEVAMTFAVDATGHPTIALTNPESGSSASLAVDKKGAHVKFDRPGGASSYLFLNNEGGSGIVLLDNAGKRKYELLLNADGSVSTGRVDNSGKLVP